MAGLRSGGTVEQTSNNQTAMFCISEKRRFVGIKLCVRTGAKVIVGKTSAQALTPYMKELGV